MLEVLINTGFGLVLGYSICRVQVAIQRRHTPPTTKVIGFARPMEVRRPRLEPGLKVFKLCYLESSGINMRVVKKLSEEFCSYFQRKN